MNVILASASPRRASLLRQVQISFTTDPSSIDESFGDHQDPETIVRSLAQKKGTDVAGRHPGSFIIAADTIVVLDHQILGKPRNADEAKKMLNKLSGRSHSVFSGVYTAKTDDSGIITKDFTFSERTKVTFSPLDETEIEHYIRGKSPFDKAGSYGIQDDLGSLFVKKIEGDYYNVVGFPLNAFYQHLKKEMPNEYQHLFFQQ